MIEKKIGFFKLNSIQKVQCVCAIYIISFVNQGIVPSLGIGTFYIFLGMFALWFIIAINIDSMFLYRAMTKAKSLLIFTAIVMLGAFYEKNFWNQYTFACIYAMTLIIMSKWYVQEKFTQQTEVLMRFYFTETIIIALRTWIVLQTEPMLIRQMTANFESEGVKAFVAGFANVYVYTVIVVFCVNLMKSIHKKHKVIIVIMCICCTMVVISANLATAVVVMIAVLILSLINKKKKVLFGEMAFFLVTFVLFKEQMAKLCYYIAKFEIFSDFIRMKIIDIGNSLLGIQNDYNTVNQRNVFVKDALEVFVNHPVLGIYGRSFSNLESKVHNHNVWFDLLARFGILRSLPLIMFIKNLIKESTKYIKELSYPTFVAYLLVIVLGFLNPILKKPMLLCVLLIIPCSKILLKGTENEKNSIIIEENIS